MSAARRKRRTRAHIIADLSLHHVAYRIVKRGHTIEPIRSDYGYDGSIFTYNGRGEIENGNIFIQLKLRITSIGTGREGRSLSKSQKKILIFGKRAVPCISDFV